jgi:LysR family hydrogen peroxide-inducible transcriptional activator
VIKLADNYAGMTLLPELVIHDWSAEQLNHIRHFSGEKPMREISIIIEKTYKRNAILKALKIEILQHLPKKIKNNSSKSPLIIN